MLEKTLGDLFREYRVRKGLQISDVETSTGVGSQYILAIELDQLALLPQANLSHYLLSYAQTVEFPLDLLQSKTGLSFIPESNESLVTPPASLSDFKPEELVISQTVSRSETVNVPLFNTVQLINVEEPIIPNEASIETVKEESTSVLEPIQNPIVEPAQRSVFQENQKPIVKFEEENLLEVPNSKESPLSTSISDRVTQVDDLSRSEISKPIFEVPEESQMSSLSRRHSRSAQQKPSKKGGSISLIFLSLVALAVLCFVGYTFVQNVFLSDKLSSSGDETTTIESTTTTQTETTTQAVVEKVSLRTEGGGETLTVYVSGEISPLEVNFTLSENAAESWVSLYDEISGDQGSLLTVANKTFTASLADGMTTGNITLGITQDVEVAINGVTLDKQALTTEGISYITLIVE